VNMTLLNHRSTSVINTTVRTKHGVVTVGGEAQNAAEKALVGKLVADINGVKKVKNRMTVR
jgi:hyperosmotically inducible protein